MNTTAEENKKTSSYLYEDDFVYLTDSEELFLKEGDHIGGRKLCEVSKENVETKVDTLQQVFNDLEQRINEALQRDEMSSQQLNKLQDKLNESTAIGDFDQLFLIIEEKKNGRTDVKTKTTNPQETSTGKLNEEGPSSNGEEPKKEEAQNFEKPIAFYKSLVKKARDVADQSNWSRGSSKLDELSRQWSEGPDTENTEEQKSLFQKFNRAISKFEEQKEEHYKKKDQKKQQNLEKRKKLLEEFEGIISNKTWTAGRRVNQMKRQWNQASPLPSGKGEKLDKRFNELLKIFNENKVDRLVQKRQNREDNLMLKLTVLEKMGNVVSSINHKTENWSEIDEKFQDLTRQWKKTGKVPQEKADEVWQRYKDTQDEYFDRKYSYDPEHQSKVDKFSHKKEKICKEAEELIEQDDLATAARKVNKLHHRWKKTGNLPQRKEDKLWNRFKAATDEFHERKANNQDKIQEQEEKHYQKKLELIDKANALKDTDDFKKGHKKMQHFMQRWKEIGPVSRKKSDEIWAQFKGAMDTFYDRRREHFKEEKEERKENLKKKKELLEKLRELGGHDDPIEAVDIAKDLQEKFKNVGYVPIKQKDKMWNQYRKACDVIYDRFRAAKSGNKFDQELAKANLDPEDRKEIQKLNKQHKKVKKQIRALEKEAIQYEEKRSYFNTSGSGNSLLDELEDKIADLRGKIEEKEEAMDALDEQMEEIRQG